MSVPKVLEHLHQIPLKRPVVFVLFLVDLAFYLVPCSVEIKRLQLELGGGRIDEVIAVRVHKHEPPEILYGSSGFLFVEGDALDAFSEEVGVETGVSWRARMSVGASQRCLRDIGGGRTGCDGLCELFARVIGRGDRGERGGGGIAEGGDGGGRGGDGVTHADGSEFPRIL